MLSEAELTQLLDDITRARIAVIGDFCLDVYWVVDPSASEASLETGLPTRPVAEQRYSLGGAGNVVSNLRAIGCGEVLAFGVVGDDPWGRELGRLPAESGVSSDGMQVAGDGWSTLAYIKPHVDGKEAERLDFGNFNTLPDACADALLNDFEQVLPDVDLVIVNEQVLTGIHTPHLRERLSAMMARRTDPVFLVDSRHHANSYPNGHLKVNDHEAVRLVGAESPAGGPVPRERAIRAANALYDARQRPVFVTRGPHGCVVRDASGLCEIPGLQVPGETDTVGAGDTALSAMAVSLAAGRQPAVAAELGGLAASVAVRKLQQTGMATPEEILGVGRAADYADPGRAEDRTNGIGGTRHADIGDSSNL